MKKAFLLFAASAMIISAFAQKPAVNSTPVKLNENARKYTLDVTEVPSQHLPKALKPNSAKSITPTWIGNSANYLTLCYSQHNCMSYEPTTGALGLIHRGGPTTGTSGEVFNNVSFDGGANWDSTTNARVYSNGTNTARHPSGSLFNPAGNTDTANLYSIAVGPANPMTGNYWNNSFVSIKKRNGTAKNILIPGNTLRTGLTFQICEDGNFYTTGFAHDLDANSYYSKWNHTLLSGTLNPLTDSIENVTVTTINPPFARYGTDTLGESNPYSSVAFNKAGTVGYWVFNGVREEGKDTLTANRPIVYKTTDKGATWNIMKDFNFGSIDLFKYYFRGIYQDTTDVRPLFSTINDVTVDANDQLHVASYIYGQYSSNTDSLGYIWSYSSIRGLMFDTFTTSDTTWDAVVIAAVNAKDYSGGGSNEVTIDARLQMGLSTDGQKIFYSWADTDPANTTDNVMPDLYIAGRHIDSRFFAVNDTTFVTGSTTVIDTITTLYYSPRITKLNITKGTSLEYTAHYHSMAPQVKDDGGEYSVYTTITQLGATQTTDPVKHWFMKDSKIVLYGSPIKITSQPVAIQEVCSSSINPIKIGLTATTDSSVTFPISYQWQYLDGSSWVDVTDSLLIPTGVTYANATTDSLSISGINTVGSYKYRCLLTNSYGYNTLYSNESIYAISALSADPALAITGSTSVCQGQKGNTYTVPAIANATSYVWTMLNGDSIVTLTNTITIDFNNNDLSGNLSVHGTNGCGNGADSSIAITINPMPTTPVISYDMATLTFTSDAVSGNQWYKNGAMITGATNQTLAVSDGGNYFTIVTTNGCVSDPSNIITNVGVEDYDFNAAVVLYPNPVSSTLNIKVDGNNNEVGFKIISSMGQVVYTGTVTNNTAVNTSDFADGVYLVKLENGKTFKFLKLN